MRREADALLTEVSSLSPLDHAVELERAGDAFDGGPQLAADIAAEMRRRAEAGVRFWPSPRVVEPAR